MTKPVVAHIDVSSSMLILRILKQGKRAAIVTVEMCPWRLNVEMWMNVEEKLFKPTDVLSSFRARPILRFCGGKSRRVIILLLTAPAHNAEIVNETSREQSGVDGAFVAGIGVAYDFTWGPRRST
jgi:hypothetical protein